nr:PREDICTED: probable WRKY transcription factor 50 [Musa acuminata subsp. malaccensis]
MAAVGVPFHAKAGSMAHFPSRSQGSSSSNSTPLHADAAAPAFDLSDFIMFDQAEFAPPSSFGPEPPVVPPMVDGGRSNDQNSNLSNITINSGDMTVNARSTGVEGERREETSRIAFRMKSEVEVLNDGFKWRKYGKKSVKNSPNPRNYYRCSTEGCSVKKRVERDREDPSYVITTYEGIHNHMSPGVVYYTTQDSVSGRYYVAGCQVPPDS